MRKIVGIGETVLDIILPSIRKYINSQKSQIRYGLQKNTYSGNIRNVIVKDDLFAK
ncbi:MAG: hypothetical protein MJY55_05885 [Bacteroidales bacterium]|nr:hypothetical protein [Bacteroidales bacterium]